MNIPLKYKLIIYNIVLLYIALMLIIYYRSEYVISVIVPLIFSIILTYIVIKRGIIELIHDS